MPVASRGIKYLACLFTGEGGKEGAHTFGGQSQAIAEHAGQQSAAPGGAHQDHPFLGTGAHPVTMQMLPGLQVNKLLFFWTACTHVLIHYRWLHLWDRYGQSPAMH